MSNENEGASPCVEAQRTLMAQNNPEADTLFRSPCIQCKHRKQKVCLGTIQQRLQSHPLHTHMATMACFKPTITCRAICKRHCGTLTGICKCMYLCSSHWRHKAPFLTCRLVLPSPNMHLPRHRFILQNPISTSPTLSLTLAFL